MRITGSSNFTVGASRERSQKRVHAKKAKRLHVESFHSIRPGNGFTHNFLLVDQM